MACATVVDVVRDVDQARPVALYAHSGETISALIHLTEKEARRLAAKLMLAADGETYSLRERLGLERLERAAS